MRRALPRALLIIAALVLGWRIVAQLRVEPDDALNRAASAFAAGDLPTAEAEAQRALAAHPLDGRAYRVLARVAAARGETARAEALIHLAVTHAPRDTVARALAAQAALQRGEYATAVSHYDYLLRVEPGLSEVVFPVLTRLAMTTAGRAELAARLAVHPQWRLALLQYFAAHAATAADLRPLLHEVARRGGLSRDEMALYIGRYVQDRQWNEGFLAWADELPPARRELLPSPVDGDFEQVLTTGAPFEWQIEPVSGVEAGIVQLGSGNGHALRVAFAGGRSPFQGVRQLLLLQPGRAYTLRWQSRLDGLDTPQGLHWVMHCASGPGATPLATDPVRGSFGWRPQQASFTVPAECPAQWLQLELAARIPAESYALGAAWFDDIVILSDDTATR